MTMNLSLEPSAWVARHLHLISRQADLPALDLACGHGRHTRALLQSGFRVEAVDCNTQTLQALQSLENLDAARLHCHCCDLEKEDWPYPKNCFACIVVTRYLHRPLLPYLVAALAPQGVLIYETFLQGQEKLGRPQNPDFLFAPQELLRFAIDNGFRVLAYEEGRFEDPQAVMLARLVAQKVGNLNP